MNYELEKDLWRRNTWWLSDGIEKVARMSVSESDEENIEVDFWHPNIDAGEWYGSLRFNAVPIQRWSHHDLDSEESCDICSGLCSEGTIHFGYDEEE